MTPVVRSGCVSVVATRMVSVAAAGTSASVRSGSASITHALRSHCIYTRGTNVEIQN